VAPVGDEFAGVASPVALTLALESLAIKSRYQNASIEAQRTKIRYLEARFDAQWGGMGAVAEAFGLAWAEAKDWEAAIRWYRRAMAANDGSASLKASEQLGNLLARQAWETLDQVRRRKGKVSAAQLATARAEIEAARDLLERLVAVQPSIERESLLGSAWLAAIASMQASYGRAEERARESHHLQLFYPALNRMAAQLVLNAGKPGGAGFDPAAVAAVRKSLAAKARDDPDFWSVAGVIELRMYVAIAARNLARELPKIEGEFEDLFARVGAPSMWTSVADQASFVLPKYAANSTGAERRAAESLMSKLCSYAGGT
jgi:tetratricopeptide (TPR) repeat protein